MIQFLGDVNARIGFWRAWKPLGDDGWPRAYLWRCGCCGLSHDGHLVGMVSCAKHNNEVELTASIPLPDADAQGIGRMCREAFMHLDSFSSAKYPMSEAHAQKTAIACLNAAKGGGDE